jgi:hypothetical protein
MQVNATRVFFRFLTGCQLVDTADKTHLESVTFEITTEEAV